MQYLTFHLKEVNYAVDVQIIETVVPYSGATAIPSPLAYVRGVMDLRGQVIPLIDLRQKFGLEATDATEGASVIVFGVSGVDSGQERKHIVGAIVDGVSEVLTIDEGTVQSAKGEGRTLWEAYVLGVVRQETGMVVVLRPEGLFSLEEIASLQRA